MIELVDHAPAVNVPPAEFARLLGYPRGHVVEGRALELADESRQWYAERGRPWIYARRAQRIDVEDGNVTIDGELFASPPLAHTLRQAEAEGVVLVAVSAGAEIEAEAARAWRDEKPDEYFFLETYGSAVVEHLVTMAGAQLCAWADGEELAVLPHYSPGYPLWDVAEQPRLLDLIKRRSCRTTPLPLDVLDSGMLRPKKSLLAVFGLTRHTERVGRLAELSPCESCCFANCKYRRAAYQGPPPYRFTESPVRGNAAKSIAAAPVTPPINLAASYGVNPKALARWASERLVLGQRGDGTIEAQFRYDGTTCNNMGRPLAFDYTVTLAGRDQGYAIESGRCIPAAGDDGHRLMCRFLEEGDRLLATISAEQPLAGARIDDVLAWKRPVCAAACYCDPDSRQHKWGLVLETIHFALAQRERGDASQPSAAPRSGEGAVR
jgi:hypothetical protein